MSDEYSEADQRRILLELRYLCTEAELCAKWKLTKAQLRRWKKAANYAYLSANFRELVILALHTGSETIPNLISHLDYLDHTIYTEAEIHAMLEKLRVEGIAKEDGGKWHYDPIHSQNDTSFIF
jgi:hypothetical protein